jgi:hypothetical protein
MKKVLFSPMLLIAAVLAVMAFTYPSFNTYNNPQVKLASIFPENVQKIFETSCYDCHSDLSSNEKAKTKLDFSGWGTLSDAKKVGKMQDIQDVISKGDMPPGKYVEKFPDRALTAEQKEVVNKCLTEESNKLMGQ